MKSQSAVAKPYARALHSLAKDRDQTEAVARDLDTVMSVVAEQPELREFLSRPGISTVAKRDVVLEIATQIELSPLTRDFLGLVAKRGRADVLEAIVDAYCALVDDDLNRVRAHVRTAVPLAASDREALRVRLSRAMSGKQVVLDEAVDGRLLGGFVAEIGSYLVDGSLDGQLARIDERLAKG